jgi:hypothetical protein
MLSQLLFLTSLALAAAPVRAQYGCEYPPVVRCGFADPCFVQMVTGIATGHPTLSASVLELAVRPHPPLSRYGYTLSTVVVCHRRCRRRRSILEAHFDFDFLAINLPNG